MRKNQTETSLVFSSRLSLPSTVSLTTNFHVLNVVQHVKDIHPLSPKHITSKLKKKFLLMWYILISATSWYPPPSCPCSPQGRRQPTHMSLMLSHTLKANKKTWMSTNITPAYHIQVEKNPSDVINPDFSDLPGLLLQVVLAVHSVVDHQLTCTLSGMLPVKKIVTTETTTVYHIPVGKKIPTEVIWFQRLCWSSPPSCLCRLQCRQPPTRMRKSRHVGYPRKEL